jgi:DNA-binding MarR family transcriptional regulator
MSRESLRREQLLDALGHAVRANQRATDQVDEAVTRLLGVNRTDGLCLDILDHRGRISAGALAEETGLTSGAITAVIDRLERAGYVRRVPDPEDRRRVLVELTEPARAIAWELFAPLAELVGELLAGYDEEQLTMLIEFQDLGRQMQERHAALLRERLRTEGQIRLSRS